MKTVNFIFGIHNHQPVGNFDFVIEEAYRQGYLPFIEVLEKHPDIHISFHFSGCLLEWLENRHPEYLDRIAQLVQNGHVEILSGGFYEPILPVIPDVDKIGQIEMMNRYIRQRFDYRPEGLWLTERVWEPALAKPIAEAGIGYVTVDDYHFLGTGKQERDLTGYYITEEQGKPLSIFPINQQLRYAIPFKDPQETVDYLTQYATEEGDNAIVMADDGEKFGVWPGTHATVFEKGWLEEFLNTLEQNRDWIKTGTFAEYLNSQPPRGRIYLPTASYFEMSAWSLPWEAGEEFDRLIAEFKEQERIEEVKPFLKGGIWRNFLFKYDESNWMQKKMLHLSERYHHIKSSGQKSQEKAKLQKVRGHLWRGSCNCAYWHGIFGGLYLPHLRHAVYRELLTCERILNQLEYRKAFHIEALDVDRDGDEELLVTHGNLHTAFVPHRGAMMAEMSLLDKSFNILNGLKRYKEAYHRRVADAGKESTGGSIHDNILAKETGLEKYLKYDRYPRKNLVDHIIDPLVTLEQFRNGDYYEDSDFIQGRYAYRIDEPSKKITFTRKGGINWQPATIEKEVAFTKNGFGLTYRLTNHGKKTNLFRFGPEFNFAMLDGNAADRYYLVMDEKPENAALNAVGIIPKITRMAVENTTDGFRLTIQSPEKADFWYFPIETVSLSEAGFERVYQSSVIVPWFELNLRPGETVEIALNLKLDYL